MLQEVAEKKDVHHFPALASSESGDDSLSSANLWNSLSESILQGEPVIWGGGC